MFSLFHDSWNAFPTFAILDHTMTVRAKPWTLDNNSNTSSCDGSNATIDGWSGGSTEDFLQQLVDECGSLCEECSGTIDTDGDGIADECDDCNNMPGDVNDDMVIDILDIVSTVNMVLTGGMNSPTFTDCEKVDADMTGDGNINILDIIQIINVVLGNLNSEFYSLDNYVDVTSDIKGNDLYLTLTSDFTSGLELKLLGEASDIRLVDNTDSFVISKNMQGLNKIALIYSMENKTFDKSLTLQIVDGSYLDEDDINIIAGNASGDRMSVRWSGAQNFSITSLYPNPFNPITKIDYSVDQAGNLRLSVYNILGQEVAVLHNGYQTEGVYNAVWDASSLSSGVYYINMIMHGHTETKKAVLVK